MGNLKGFLEGSVYSLTRKYLSCLLIPLMFLNDSDGRNINLQRLISLEMGLDITKLYLHHIHNVVETHNKDIGEIFGFDSGIIDLGKMYVEVKEHRKNLNAEGHKKLTEIVKEARDALENDLKDYCPEITEVVEGGKKEQYRRVTFISLDGKAMNKDNIPTEGFKKRARDSLKSAWERGFFENYPYIELAQTSNGKDIYLAATYIEMFDICGTCHVESTSFRAIIFPVYPNKLNELEKIFTKSK